VCFLAGLCPPDFPVCGVLHDIPIVEVFSG